MTRRYGGGPAPHGTGGWTRRALRPAGSLAWFDGTCWICDRPIQRHVHQIVARKSEWIHTTCASGADE